MCVMCTYTYSWLNLSLWSLPLLAMVLGSLSFQLRLFCFAIGVLAVGVDNWRFCFCWGAMHVWSFSCIMKFGSRLINLIILRGTMYWFPLTIMGAYMHCSIICIEYISDTRWLLGKIGASNMLGLWRSVWCVKTEYNALHVLTIRHHNCYLNCAPSFCNIN